MNTCTLVHKARYASSRLLLLWRHRKQAFYSLLRHRQRDAILATCNIPVQSAFFCTICSYTGDHVTVYRPMKSWETYQINNIIYYMCLVLFIMSSFFQWKTFCYCTCMLYVSVTKFCELFSYNKFWPKFNSAYYYWFSVIILFMKKV